MRTGLRLAAILTLAVVWFAGTACAHGSHSVPHPVHATIDQDLAAYIVHGVVLGAAVFLAGLAAFVILVWVPTSRSAGAGRDAEFLFVRWMWALFGLLAIAGTVELSLYAVRASGEPFSFRLLSKALFDTRVDHIWSVRLGLGLLAAVVATGAARLRQPVYWWFAAGVGSVMLVTLTRLSHAAAEGRFLPFLADWIHVNAAALWMGGLLGFPIVLLGPLRAMSPDQRTKLRRRMVRRFSGVATVAVVTLIVTGLYAILLHVPGLSALIGTPYGRALSVKLGLLTLLLAAGGMNLLLQGREPFGRVVGVELVLAISIFVATGFLTSPPPPGP